MKSFFINENIKKSVLWGASNLAAECLLLLKKLNVEVETIIDLYSDTSHFNGIQIEKPEDYFNHHDLSTPIIVTAESKNQIHRFRQIGQYIDQLRMQKDIKNINNLRLLHPSFLSAFQPMDLSDHIAVCGFPGSGNIVVGNIIRILNPENENNTLFKRLALSHFMEIQNALIEPLKYNGVIKFFFNNHKVNQVELLAISDDGYINIQGIRASNYLFNKVYTSHETLTKESLCFLAKNKVPVVVVIRNPLDIIISNAFKISQMHLLHAQKNHPEMMSQWIDSNSILRKSWCIGKLENRDWFETIIDNIHIFYENLLSFQKEVLIVRYERLLSEPANEIRRIGKYLNQGYSEQMIEKAVSLVGKPLSTDPTHFNDPGKGKWKVFLTQALLDRVKEKQLNGLMAEFGYDSSLILGGGVCKQEISLSNKENQFLAYYLNDLRKKFELTYKSVDLPSGININGTSNTLLETIIFMLGRKNRESGYILGSLDHDIWLNSSY